MKTNKIYILLNIIIIIAFVYACDSSSKESAQAPIPATEPAAPLSAVPSQPETTELSKTVEGDIQRDSPQTIVEVKTDMPQSNVKAKGQILNVISTTPSGNDKDVSISSSVNIVLMIR